MEYLKGEYTTGAIYEYSTQLSLGTGYTYNIDCYDYFGGSCTVLSGNGPDVLCKVSGYVKDPLGIPMNGIEVKAIMNLDSETAVTDTTGYYELLVSTGTYYITIPHDYYQFEPSTYTLSGIVEDTSGYDFTRISRSPELNSIYTSQSGYSGISRSVCEPGKPMSLSILYKDPDRDPIKSKYPVVHITKDNAAVQTLILSEDSGSSEDGIVYTTSTYINRVGDYDYTVEAYDIFNKKALDYTGTFEMYCLPPPAAVASTLTKAQAGATVPNARIFICWCDCEGAVEYVLYLSEPMDVSGAQHRVIPKAQNSVISGLSEIYRGENPRFTIECLEAGKEYLWQAEAINQYGASSLSPLYSFKTLASVRAEKSFNYPNPFNPAIGENTNIVFNMEEAGSAEITIYSEYGDLCWKKSYHNLPQGTNEEIYDGTDDSGRMMYNGTYVCLVRKTYNSGRKQRDFCRILIIK